MRRRCLPQPWNGEREATLFSHWIYHHLKPHAARLQMSHAARMKAISAGKQKSDKIDARTTKTWCDATCCRSVS